MNRDLDLLSLLSLGQGSEIEEESSGLSLSLSVYRN